MQGRKVEFWKCEMFRSDIIEITKFLIYFLLFSQSIQKSGQRN